MRVEHDPANLRQLAAKAEREEIQDLVSFDGAAAVPQLWETWLLIPYFIFFFQKLSLSLGTPW